MTAWAVALAAAALLAVILFGPRVLISRAQNGLARNLMDSKGAALRLLTRAEMVAGAYRRIPGVLAFEADVLAFTGVHGDSCVLPMASVQKIATGRRLAAGRMLFRREVVRLTRTDGEEVEFVVSPASAHAWRSHLGLWAGRERQAAAETVTPGR